MPMTLTEIAEGVHATAKEKGFWQHAQHRYNPSIVPEKLMLIVTEVAEAMEAYRDGDEKLVEEELADVIIRVLDLSQWKRYDIEGAVYAKMNKNRRRPHMHGRSC